MIALEFRNGDRVEVNPGYREGRLLPAFCGTVADPPRGNGRSSLDARFDWVWIITDGSSFPGGWYPEQCKLLERPVPEAALPIPPNVILGES